MTLLDKSKIFNKPFCQDHHFPFSCKAEQKNMNWLQEVHSLARLLEAARYKGSKPAQLQILLVHYL